MLFQSSVMRKQVKNLLLYEVTYITSNVSEIQQLRLLIVALQEWNPIFMNLQMVDLGYQSVIMISNTDFVKLFLLQVLL